MREFFGLNLNESGEYHFIREVEGALVLATYFVCFLSYGFNGWSCYIFWQKKQG